jgi:hypothetical protein
MVFTVWWNLRFEVFCAKTRRSKLMATVKSLDTMNIFQLSAIDLNKLELKKNKWRFFRVLSIKIKWLTLFSRIERRSIVKVNETRIIKRRVAQWTPHPTQEQKTRVQIPPSYKVFRETIAMLLCLHNCLNMHCLCAEKEK